MEEKVINLQPIFAMNNAYLVKFLNECFSKLNAFLKTKSGATKDPLFVREEKGKIVVGYIPRTKGKTHFYSNESFDDSWDALSRICLVQFVIFEGCKEYGCYEEVPMAGAPEEGHDAYFTFVFENIKYIYQLWTK